jgi:hypothetical protein
MIGYFRKNMSNIPGDNGSSLNILITLKINVLAKITVTKTSVLAVYPSLVYSFYYPPLLCTSCDVSKICLPPMYIPIESSPNDQISPKLFSLIKITIYYISSDNFVLNKSISMELRFNTFPLSSWCDNILNILKDFNEFWAIARYRAPLRRDPRVMKMSVIAGTRHEQ